jgi:hypothetical protein
MNQPFLDLDLAAQEIEQRRAEWAKHHFEFGPLTWRDSREWPPRLAAREAVADPDSVGMRVHRGVAQGSVVLFRGGWADVEWWEGSLEIDSEMTAPDVADIAAFCALLDALLNRWAQDC